MKKFKLIKVYPNSPPLNVIYEEILGICGNESGRMYKRLDKSGCCLDSREVEGFEEHWKKVEVKSEIDPNPLKLKLGQHYKLKYVHCKDSISEGYISRFTTDGYPWMENREGSSGIISPGSYEIVQDDFEIIEIQRKLPHRKDGSVNIWTPDHPITLNNMLYVGASVKGGQFFIQSIKRESDGAIFKIGDALCQHESWENSVPCIITKFNVSGTNIKACIYQEGYGYGKYTIKDSSFVSTPLFKADDGVNIYRGNDKYYLVVEMMTIIESNVAEWRNKFIKEALKDTKRFSTRDLAEDYVLNHKKCLSVNDVANVLQNTFDGGWREGELCKQLRKIIKGPL
jgi:hypothetical protein